MYPDLPQIISEGSNVYSSGHYLEAELQTHVNSVGMTIEMFPSEVLPVERLVFESAKDCVGSMSDGIQTAGQARMRYDGGR